MLHIRLCCVFCLSTNAQFWQFQAMTELLCFRAKRRTSDCQANTQSQLGINNNNNRKKEQRKATLHCVFMSSANGIWFSSWRFCSMFEHLDSAQPWARGEATNKGSSISVFYSSSTVTSVGHSSLGTKSFILKPVADNRSYSKAACRLQKGW